MALDDLIVLIPAGELGYMDFVARLMDRDSIHHKDFGQLMARGRVLYNASAYTHSNVYGLVQRALKVEGWKRALILEHDHEFPAGFLRQHASYKEPVVGGLYVLRDIYEPLPVIYRWNTARNSAEFYNAEELQTMGLLGNDQARGLHEVDIVPLGCTSIRRDVFENWRSDQPIFSSYTNSDGKTIGHDVFFCRMVQDQGWAIYVDTSMQVSHYVKVPVNDDTFTRWWAEVGKAKNAQAMDLKVVENE